MLHARMTANRRPLGSAALPANGRNRRNLVVPARSGEGRLTEQRAVARPRPRERVFMPQSGLSAAASGICRIGGKRTLLNELRLCTWLRGE